MKGSFDREELRRRARGVLLGAAVGDSMGAPCEGLTAEEIEERYGVVRGFVRESGGGTDDTDFTLFNAHLLLTYGTGITQAQVEAEWRSKLLSGDYFYRPGGFSDVVAVNNLREGMHAPQSGSCNHQMWSDGVAMAIGSAGIAAAGRPRKAAELADRLGAVSNGRDGLYTARAVAAAISVAMTGANPDEMVDAAVDALPRDSWSYRCMVQARRIGATNTGDHARLVGAINEQLIYGWWPWADLATEAVPVAFAFFLALKGDFARAVPTSIRIGRDADTIGAIVGSLSGAYGGFDAIPEEWRERVTVSQGNAIGFIANRPIVEVADALAEGVTYEAL